MWDSGNEKTLSLQRAGKLKLKHRDEPYFAPRLSFRKVDRASDEEM